MISIKVKNEILSKTTITSISYNHKYGLLAVVADASDTVAFYSFQYQTSTQPNSQKQLILGNGFIDFHQHQFVLMERFKGESKPPASNSICWSHNGVYIAVAGNKVQIWKLEAGRMAPFRVINQGYIDIKSIKWCDDNKSYLCYGISPKTQPISINIRNIQSSQLRQILPAETPVLCSFDPFGKYISVLNIKNKIELYDSHSLDKIKIINLSQSANDIPTLKDKREGDWSPEYGYFVCPNLNDSKISTAVIMDRNRGFQCVSVLIGHQAVINCVKFCPKIYKDDNGKIFFLLAMGDSSGCLSLWRIFYKQPAPELIFITSSPIKAEQSIQNIQWSCNGNKLIINSLKKYLTIIKFRQGMERGDFGSFYSDDKKSQFIVGIYGARGAADIVEAKFQVFGLQGVHKADDYLPTQKISIQTKFQQRPKQNMVKTKQEVFYLRDANNKQKKRINPSRIIPESQAIQETANAISNVSQAGPTNYTPSLKLPTIRLAPLKAELKREYKVENKKIICIERVKDLQIVSIKQRDSHQGNYLDLNTRYFNSDLKLVTVSNKQIFLLTQDKLYIFDYFLKPVQLPIYIGQISNFCSNNQGTIYYMLTNGVIRGFNFINRTNFVETSAAYLLMGQETQTIVASPFSMFVVFDDDNERLHVEMKSSLKRYFFCKQSNSWVQLDFEQGLYQLGHSLKIPKSQQKSTKKFYQSLLSSSLALSTVKPNPITELQSQLLYHYKYSKDNDKYKESLIKYLLQLKKTGNDEQLRRQIYKYFIDANSGSYMGHDAGLWSKVIKIGGKVIEEFVIFGNQG